MDINDVKKIKDESPFIFCHYRKRPFDDYDDFKARTDNPIIKKYDTFELIQFKNDNSIINIISLSAKDDYKI